MLGVPLRNRARQCLIFLHGLAREHWALALFFGVLVAVAIELAHLVGAHNAEVKNQKGKEHALSTIAVVGTGAGKAESDLGSGVFINTGGVFITNDSILKDRALSTIWVQLPDGKRYAAPSKICANARYDVAVLKFNGQGLQGLPVPTLGDSDGVRGGQEVIVASGRWGPWGTSPVMQQGAHVMYPATWSPEADPAFAIRLIQFSAERTSGMVLGINGNLLGIVATPDDIPKSMQKSMQTTNLAVPINVFRPFFEQAGAPKGLTGTAGASQDTTVSPPQRKLCRGLNPDYFESLEQEMAAEAQAIAAGKHENYPEAFDHYKEAMKHLRHIASARTTSPDAALQSEARKAESLAASAESTSPAAALNYYEQELQILKWIAFSSKAGSPASNGNMKLGE